MNDPKSVEDLLRSVDLKAVKIDPKAKYLFVAVINEDVDARDLERVRWHVQAQVPNAVVLFFAGDVNCKLFDISDKPALTLPVKPASDLIQDREAQRRI